MPDNRPLIGISAYWRAVDFGPWRDYPVTFVPQGYVDGIAAAGGLPFLVPPLPELADDPAPALDRLDGLLLAGGEDVDPRLYGAERDPATGAPNELRDRVELALLREALARDLPMLGVCRGAQLLNVAYGGDLVQDIDRSRHHERTDTRGWGHHPVRVTGGRLRRLAGDEIGDVATYHHQAFGRLGDGLVATAESPDGIIEALEDPRRAFCLGVLWHPDEHARDDGLALFRALVDAARASSRGR